MLPFFSLPPYTTPKYSNLQLLPNRTPYLMFSKVFDIQIMYEAQLLTTFKPVSASPLFPSSPVLLTFQLLLQKDSTWKWYTSLPCFLFQVYASRSSLLVCPTQDVTDFGLFQSLLWTPSTQAQKVEPASHCNKVALISCIWFCTGEKCKWMQSSMQMSSILALSKTKPTMLMPMTMYINSHLNQACSVFRWSEHQGVSFFFCNNCDFISNSKFMILDKKPTGHNAVLSGKDSWFH